jgi:Tricorn protease C1 domain/Peptidase family S41
MRGNSNPSTAPTGTAPTDVAAQFEQMWATFDRNYSYFDHKRIDWNALKAEFAPRVAGVTQNELVMLVQSMLGRLHDQHVVLTSGSTTLRTYTPDYFVNWDNSVWQQYLARGNAQVRNAAVSAVFDGVPYIAVQSWNPARVNVSDLDTFLDAFRDRPALILDVRMNPGGFDQPAFDFAGRFATSTTTSGFFQFPERSRPQRFHTAPGPHLLSARFVSVHRSGAVAHRTLLREQQRIVHRGDAAVAAGHAHWRYHGRFDGEPADVRVGRWMVVQRLAVDRVHSERPGHRGSGHRAQRRDSGVGRGFSKRPGSGARLRDRTRHLQANELRETGLTT